MAATQNYSLPLPQLGEPADIRVLDQGTEMIDGIMHGNRTMIAPGWVSTETYNTGNRVVYLGEYYKCKADNVTGAWDATKWDKLTVGEDIEALGTGGASALSDLDDVEITSPTDGQALLYDDSDDTWKNSTLPDPSVVKEVTGNPVEFTDGADAPLVKCTTAITGSQDLHGYDKPWVGGAGINKLDPSTKTTTNSNTRFYVNQGFELKSGRTYTLIFFGDIDLSGIYINTYPDSSRVAVAYNAKTLTYTATEDMYVSFDFYKTGEIPHDDNLYMLIDGGNVPTSWSPWENICPITAYSSGDVVRTGGDIIPKGKNTANGYVENAWIGQDGTTTAYPETDRKECVSEYFDVSNYSEFVYTTNESLNNAGLSFYDSNKAYISGVKFSYQPSITVSVPSNAKYCRSTFFEKPATAYVRLQPKNTHTATFTNSIYQGNADFVGGTETHDMPVIDLGDLTWTKDERNRFNTTGISDIKRVATLDTVANLVCEIYPAISANNTYRQNDGISVTTTGQVNIYDSTKTNMTTEDFKTAVTGIKLAYELATPTTETITPTNLPIKSLSGYNHIESSTGDMVVDYIRDTYQPIVDLIQSSSHVYSTAEQVVGKWVNNENLYERIIEFTNVTINGGETDFKYKGDLMIKSIIPDADIILPDLQHSYYVVNSEQFSFLGFRVNCNTGELVVVTLFAVTNADLHICLQYTKTPSSTRSLSAPVTSQKAQIEPLEEKGEETPVEEEKAVETPVETEEENEEER